MTCNKYLLSKSNKKLTTFNKVLSVHKMSNDKLNALIKKLFYLQYK